MTVGAEDRAALAKLASGDPSVASPARQAAALGVVAIFLPTFVYAGISSTARYAAGSSTGFVDLMISATGLLLGLMAFVLGIQARRRKNGIVKRLIGSQVKEAGGIPLVEKSGGAFRVIMEGNDFQVKKKDRAMIRDGVENVVAYLQDGKRLFALAINGDLVNDLR
jgi:hypothetical protein